MQINPESKPISEIFPIEGKSTYIIPIFQRNYSWTNNNIEELYNDIINEESGYYIGNLLVTRGINKYEYEIVDGQQRLTTIALYFLAIYEELNDLIKQYDNKDNIIGEIHAMKADIRRKLLVNQEEPRLKLLEPDAEIFKNYLKVLSGGTKGKFGNRTFGKRYNFIRNLVSNDEYGQNDFERIKDFYNKLNDIELLRITVNNLTDAYSVFTSLNAKGLPLTLIDLLKSYYLREAVQHYSTNRALEEWNRLIDIFSNTSGEPNSTAVTQFLLNNYDTFEAEGTSSITKRASLRKYEDLFKKKGHQYMENLIINAKIFSKIIPKIKSSIDIEFSESIQIKLEKLSKLETSSVYPIILYILKQLYLGNITDETVEKIFDYLINYYVRRNIVLKPKSSNIRSKALQAVRALQQDENLINNSLNIIKMTLGKIAPSDEEFLTALKGSIYDISPQTVRFVLIELERKHGQYFNKQNRDTLDEYQNNKPIWSLEHILPQTDNLNDEWKEMISPDNIELAFNIQKDNMHKIGNLTLTAYNSEMSDKSFIEKRDYKPKNSTEYTGLRTKLFLNNSIPNINIGETIETKEKWTIEDINRRTEYLANLVLKAFPLN